MVKLLHTQWQSTVSKKWLEHTTTWRWTDTAGFTPIQ